MNNIDKGKMHHYMAIEMHMQTWNLLGNDNRNEKDDVRMINFSKASLYHWQNSPKYEPINEKRGLWLISHVYAVLKRGIQALEYAKTTLQLTEKYGFKDFDLAYTYEAMARAYAGIDNKIKCQEYMKKVEGTGEQIKQEEDKKFFLDDFSSEPWFGCK